MKKNNPKTGFSHLREQVGLSIKDLSAELGFSVRTLYRWEKGETKPRQAAIHVLQNMVNQKNKPLRLVPKFTFIDLFAGVGGLRKGFDLIGGKCIFTSEWDKYAQLTYKANFDSDHEIIGDIRPVTARDIPPHDLLLAGFPCQPFSIAGVSKKKSLGKPHGFRCKTQGTLFYDVARIIEYHQPGAFLLENVKNLVNHDKGRTFKRIHKTLKNELGYHVSCKVIDARSWVPQNRERIFIAGFRDNNTFSFDGFQSSSPMNGPRLGTILHPEDGTEPEEKPYTLGKKARVSDKYTLSDHLWNYLQAYAEKHRKRGNGFGFGLVGPDDVSRTLSARYYKDGSEILVRQKGKNPRRLTPRECARLMGFDRPGSSGFVIPVSDTQAYKQFGNAVAVPMVNAIARYMAPQITGEPQQLPVFPEESGELFARG